jgi:uncharacterized membrane-anchored protein
MKREAAESAALNDYQDLFSPPGKFIRNLTVAAATPAMPTVLYRMWEYSHLCLSSSLKLADHISFLD